MNIAISGKMGSGKSYLSGKIHTELGYEQTSFAKRVKELAIDLFGMEEKDRGLLIDIGTKMREIDSMVWINQVLKNTCSKGIVLDDLRLENEYNALKKNGWFLVKIDIDETVRVQRLKDVYKEKYKNHQIHFNSITENDVTDMTDDAFDFVVHNQSDIVRLLNHLKSLNTGIPNFPSNSVYI
tara:strand:- start:3039 stop:3584 length:546 start_codon:yes stop_codon:yes gene_type:complete